jgi:putative nucleotidyltransferase with HDIG domain
MPNLEKIIMSGCEIPPMPTVAQQILRMIANPDTTAERLQAVILADQGLTTQILKNANSPFYGVPRAVRTLSTAIMILGYKMIRNVALATATKSINRRFGLTEKMMWEHSIGASIASFLIAKEVRFPDPEEAFLAGLLHDIGKQILNNHENEKYMHVIERTYNEGVTFYFAEKEVFGFTHPEVGALVAKKWKLSEELENAIRYHHDGFQTLTKENPVNMGKLPVIINLADLICITLGIGRKEPMPQLNIAHSDSATILRLTEDSIQALTDKIFKNFEVEKESFGH